MLGVTSNRRVDVTGVGVFGLIGLQQPVLQYQVNVASFQNTPVMSAGDGSHALLGHQQTLRAMTNARGLCFAWDPTQPNQLSHFVAAAHRRDAHDVHNIATEALVHFGLIRVALLMRSVELGFHALLGFEIFGGGFLGRR